MFFEDLTNSRACDLAVCMWNRKATSGRGQAEKGGQNSYAKTKMKSTFITCTCSGHVLCVDRVQTERQSGPDEEGFRLAKCSSWLIWSPLVGATCRPRVRSSGGDDRGLWPMGSPLTEGT